MQPSTIKLSIFQAMQPFTIKPSKHIMISQFSHPTLHLSNPPTPYPFKLFFTNCKITWMGSSQPCGFQISFLLLRLHDRRRFWQTAHSQAPGHWLEVNHPSPSYSSTWRPAAILDFIPPQFLNALEELVFKFSAGPGQPGCPVTTRSHASAIQGVKIHSILIFSFDF